MTIDNPVAQNADFSRILDSTKISILSNRIIRVGLLLGLIWYTVLVHIGRQFTRRII